MGERHSGLRPRPVSGRRERPLGRAELVALMDRHGLRPSRAFGQNFLVDPNVAERIARLAAVGPGDEVVEIGAGLGSLTIALAHTGAHVRAIERDRHLLPALSELVSPLGVEVVEGDALALDWRALLGEGPVVLVANLPYNVATPLIAELLKGVPAIARMLVMIQREAGERLAAAPGSKVYGAVSVRVAYFALVSVVSVVPASVFVPRPNVESVLVEVRRRPEPPATAPFSEIDRLVTAAFATRRKMLRRSLADLVSEAAFARGGIDPSRRPEELSLEEWDRLAVASGQEGPP